MSSARNDRSEGFFAIHVRARDARAAECAAADAFAAGAGGLEEGEESTAFVLYASRAAVAAVRASLAEHPVVVEADVPVIEQDWSELWKAELGAIEISPRLVVRPSFVSGTSTPGQVVVEVDPGQAFGTGSHESTRLALEWIDTVADSLAAGSEVLDVGTGSGLLALALLGLAPVRAVGFDLDPLASEAALRNAARNGLADRVRVFTGGIEALAPDARFALVVANLLRRELEPVLPAIAAHTAPGGCVIVSGLLAPERDRVEARAAAVGLAREGARERVDASGETWIALLMRRAHGDASPRPVDRG